MSATVLPRISWPSTDASRGVSPKRSWGCWVQGPTATRAGRTVAPGAVDRPRASPSTVLISASRGSIFETHACAPRPRHRAAESSSWAGTRQTTAAPAAHIGPIRCSPLPSSPRSWLTTSTLGRIEMSRSRRAPRGTAHGVTASSPAFRSASASDVLSSRWSSTTATGTVGRRRGDGPGAGAPTVPEEPSVERSCRAATPVRP